MSKLETHVPEQQFPITSLAQVAPTEILQQYSSERFRLIICSITVAFWAKSFLWLTMAQQKAIMMVCKTWYLCGKRYLYQDIDIKRPTQLFELLASLKRAPENGELVKGLHVSCFIDSKWAHKFSKTLQSVVDRLHSLLAFTLRSHAMDSATLDEFQIHLFARQNEGLAVSLDLMNSTLDVKTPLFQGLKSVLTPQLVGLQLMIELDVEHAELKDLQLLSLESI